MNLKIINPTSFKTTRRKKRVKRKVRNKRLGERSRGAILKTKSKGGEKTLAIRRRKRRKTRNTSAKRIVRRRVTRRRKRRNPSSPKVVYRTTTRYRNRTRHVNRRRSFRRKRRNPEILGGGGTTDILMKAGAAGVGGVLPSWITSTFGIEGNMKYLAQLITGAIGYYILGSVGAKKYASPFAFGVIAVTAYQFAKDKDLLAGYYGLPAGTGLVERGSRMISGMGSVPILPAGMNGSVPLSGSVPVQSYSLEGWNQESDN